MQKINCSILINAPVENVWNTMLEDATYREWTKVFDEGSHYEGNWAEGSEIHFLSSDKKTGMLSWIEENRLHEYISIQHIGVIKDGEADTTSEEVKQWAPSFENYSFKEIDGSTEISIEMDIDEEHKKMFEDLWPRALKKLKELAEK